MQPSVMRVGRDEAVQMPHHLHRLQGAGQVGAAQTVDV